MTAIGLSGTQYQFDSKLIKEGGEGKIYKVLGANKVAKIYKDGVSTLELVEKLKYMINNKPSSSVLEQVAWPLDIIYEYNSQQKFLGFIMPLLNFNAELGEIYKYPSESNISSHYKILVAENICAVISEVHKAGYVFGDFNPRNIGVNKNTGEVAFLDTDSYHIVIEGAGNKAYRCNVCAPGYSAPELLEKCRAHISKNQSDKDNAYAKTPLPTFTKETDNFALAIHIFKLLFNGFSPFEGIPDKQSPSFASPGGTGDEAVRRNSYCFKWGFKHRSVAIPPLESFPKNISDLFTRAFIRGKSDPKQRPSALEWHEALVAYEKNLVTCANNPLHQYDKKNNNCPLCKADEAFKNRNSTTQHISQKKFTNVVRPPKAKIKRNISIPKKAKIAMAVAFSVGVIISIFGIFNERVVENSENNDYVEKYKTVKIGNQIWMAENLNYNTNGSRCYDNNPANCKKYGRLYDWNTAMKICDSGWHLPNNAEWLALANVAGGTAKGGKYLKSASGWNGTDAYGFAALPGGYLHSDGSFRNIGNGGYWWSASENGTGKAYNLFMRSHHEIAGLDGDSKSALFSVRCVKD